MITVLSVPHTGTRYTCKFLEHLGVNYRQLHAEPANYEDLQYLDGKAIIPMRDPLLQFLSAHFRANLEGPEKTLKFYLACWDMLGELSEGFEVEYLRLDGDGQLEKIAKFIDVPYAGDFVSGPVGAQFKEPVGLEMWAKHKVEGVEKALAPYRERYGY